MSRIYLITDKVNNVNHLIRANNQAQALRRVANGQFETRVANQEALVDLLGKGTTVQDATADEVPAEPVVDVVAEPAAQEGGAQ